MANVEMIEGAFGFEIRVRLTKLSDDFAGISGAKFFVITPEEKEPTDPQEEEWAATVDATNEYLVVFVDEPRALLPGTYKVEVHIDAPPFHGRIDRFEFRVRKKQQR